MSAALAPESEPERIRVINYEQLTFWDNRQYLFDTELEARDEIQP